MEMYMVSDEKVVNCFSLCHILEVQGFIYKFTESKQTVRNNSESMIAPN